MKRKFLLILTAVILCLLLPLTAASADGASYPYVSTPGQSYDGSFYGVVICSQMSVRNQPSTSGNSYGTIKNGQPVRILGSVTNRNTEFYMIDLASCGLKGTPTETYGYAKANLIKAYPEYIHVTSLTNLYATPWGDGMKNGEQTNRFFLVISENNNWYAVQSTVSSAGSAFIRTSDAPRRNRPSSSLTPSYNTSTTSYIVTGKATVYDEFSMAMLQKVDSDTPCELISVNGEYSLVLFNKGLRNEFRAWIRSEYISPRSSGGSVVDGGEYVVIWDTNGFDEYSMARSQKIQRFTNGYLTAVNGDYSLLVFNRGQNGEYRLWVNNLYIAPVVN